MARAVAVSREREEAGDQEEVGKEERGEAQREVL